MESAAAGVLLFNHLKLSTGHSGEKPKQNQINPVLKHQSNHKILL
jgi:hypothetical protein